MTALAESVRAAARRFPQAPALLRAGEALSWHKLEARSAAAAAALRGAAPGAKVVALCSGSAAAAAVFAHAGAFAGVAFMPLGPLLPRERREALLAAAGPVALFGEGGADPSPVLAAFSAPGSAGGEALEPEVELIIATSGSSGEPKGVMLSPANLRAAALASAARLPLAPGDTWLACLPLHHVGGMAILHRCALGGAALLLHEGFDAARLAADLARHAVTHVSLVPPMLARLLEAGAPPPSLKAALVGGGELSAPLYRRARDAGWPVMPSYGLTECCAQVATLHAPGEGWESGDCGPPLPGVAVGIASPDAAGVGRIRVRGATVMRGYLNPELRPGEGLADGAFLTADLGRLDERGHLVVLGRADDMLVSGGVNVHPAEPERLLCACPGVSEAAVTGRRDPVWGELLVAVYRGEAEPAALEAWCRERLHGPLRPRAFLRVQSLPLTPQGKLDRRTLRRLAEAPG